MKKKVKAQTLMTTEKGEGSKMDQKLQQIGIKAFKNPEKLLTSFMNCLYSFRYLIDSFTGSQALLVYRVSK